MSKAGAPARRPKLDPKARGPLEGYAAFDVQEEAALVKLAKDLRRYDVADRDEAARRCREGTLFAAGTPQDTLLMRLLAAPDWFWETFAGLPLGPPLPE